MWRQRKMTNRRAKDATSSKSLLATVFQAAVVLPVLLAIGFGVISRPNLYFSPEMFAWIVILAAVFPSNLTTYLVNSMHVATYMSLTSGVSISQVFRQLRLGALQEFILSYLGLRLVGLVIVRLYVLPHFGFWSVAVFILPLV